MVKKAVPTPRNAVLAAQPSDVVFHVSSFLTPAGLLRLALSTGSRSPLRAPLAECANLTRAARVRRETEETLFARWARLPDPLLGALVTLPIEMLSKVYLGAALTGVVALSRLDILARRHAGNSARRIARERQNDDRDLKRSVQAARSNITADHLDIDDTQLEHLIEQTTDVFKEGGGYGYGGEASTSQIGKAVLELMESGIIERLGEESPEVAWLDRHGAVSCSMPSPGSGTIDILLSTRSCVSDFLYVLLSDSLSGVFVGSPDIASAIDRSLTRPLQRVARSRVCAAHAGSEEYSCACCLATATTAALSDDSGGTTDHDGGAVALAPTHRCDPPLMVKMATDSMKLFELFRQCGLAVKRAPLITSEVRVRAHQRQRTAISCWRPAASIVYRPDVLLLLFCSSPPKGPSARGKPGSLAPKA